jgi:hypothetical protein
MLYPEIERYKLICIVLIISNVIILGLLHIKY